MIAKAGLGLVGLSAIGMGGVAFVKPEWLGINKEAPWTPLSKDHGFSASTSAYGESSFGKKYKGVLTGVVGTNSESGFENTNGGWWNKSFEQLKADSKEGKVSDKFKYNSDNNKSKVNTGISDSQGKGLNQICNEVYKAANIKITETGTGNDWYKESDVWKYCSPLGSKPKSVKEETNPETTYTAGTIGGTDSNKDKLVSTTGNEKFWELREKEFKGIGKYQKIEAEKDDFFDPDKGKSIRDLCEDAYKKTGLTEGKSTSKTPKTDKAIKYCSMNKE